MNQNPPQGRRPSIGRTREKAKVRRRMSRCQCGKYVFDADACPEHRDDDDDDEQSTYDTRHGSDFRKARTKTLEQAEHKCESCGLTDEEHRGRDDLRPIDGGLHVHHIQPTKDGGTHEQSNLMVLCDDCHPDMPGSNNGDN